MIPTPFRFFEVEEKVLGPDAAPFGEAQFGEAPETLDAMDVIFTARELVLMMVDKAKAGAARTWNLSPGMESHERQSFVDLSSVSRIIP